jgi:hypothetical protein
MQPAASGLRRAPDHGFIVPIVDFDRSARTDDAARGTIVGRRGFDNAAEKHHRDTIADVFRNVDRA